SNDKGSGPVRATDKSSGSMAFFAPRVHRSRTMKSCGNPESVPCAVSKVLDAADDNAMLGRHAGEWRSHADSSAVTLKKEEATGAKAGVCLRDLVGRGVDSLSHSLD